MNTFVVDASFVVKWFLNEPGSETARKIRETPHILHAPELLLLEIGSVLWKRNIKGELIAQPSQEILETLIKSPIIFHADKDLFLKGFHIAQKTKRSVYDSAYLALAIDLNCPLITADRKFFDGTRGFAEGNFLKWFEDAFLL